MCMFQLEQFSNLARHKDVVDAMQLIPRLEAVIDGIVEGNEVLRVAVDDAATGQQHIGSIVDIQQGCAAEAYRRQQAAAALDAELDARPRDEQQKRRDEKKRR